MRADGGRSPLVRLSGQVALLEQEALDAARGALRDHTRVAVVVNADSLAGWFLPALTAVPDVLVDLRTDDEAHTARLLRDGTVMAAVTTERTAVQGCRVLRLGAMRYLAVATPALHAARFADRDPATTLPTATMIRFDRKDNLQHGFARTLTRRDVDPPTHFVPGTAAFTEAIRLGLGWGCSPRPSPGRTSPPVASSSWPPAGTSTCRCTGSAGGWNPPRWRR